MRNFSVTLEEMLEDAATKLAQFLEDIVDFTAFDVDLDATFGTDMAASITASENWESSETREDQGEQNLEDLKLELKEGHDAHAMAKYFIEKAFSLKPGIMKKFGLDNFTESSQTQEGMVLYLANMHEKCEDADYKPQLLAANMTQLQIDSIETAREAIFTKNVAQNLFNRQSRRATDARDAQYNATFAFSQRLNRASKVVYLSDLTHMSEYNLPHGSAGADHNVEGKVFDGSNNNKELKGVLVRLTIAGVTPIILEVLTNFAGNWGFEDVPAGNHTLEFIREGYTTVSNVAVALPAGEKKTVNQTLVLA